MIDRETFLATFKAAQDDGDAKRARLLAIHWLKAWPGDAQAVLALAQLELDQKRFGTAIDRLEKLIVRDPEDAEAYKALARTHRSNGNRARAEVYAACALALEGRELPEREAPAWTASLARAVRALANHQPRQASTAAQEALLADAHLPLPAWIATRALVDLGEIEAAMGQARAILDRWPSSTAARLILADLMIQRGETNRAVEYLHRCAAEDPTGELAARVLGDEHPYRRVWPRHLEAEVAQTEANGVAGDVEIDPRGTEVASTSEEKIAEPVEKSPTAEGVTANPEPGRADPGSPPGDGVPSPLPGEAFDGPDPGDVKRDRDSDALHEVHQEFRRLAAQLRVGDPDGNDKRAPTYIVLSSRTRLIQELGEEGFDRVKAAANVLVDVVRRRRKGWSAHLLFVDDPETLRPFKLSPVDPGNAWQIKLRLADLDSVLAERGQMIGALLIVGGHDIVPFHMLPNPTDDEDQEVPSDNPYATLDENYFAPEWPVGRLPSDEADLLSRQLRAAAEEHKLAGSEPAFSSRLRGWLRARLGRFFGVGPESIGYTASVWKRASMAVFRSIGHPRTMMSSPPVEARSLPSLALQPTTLSYYNLHGLEDAPEWYGQRDPLRDREAEEFPVALRVQDVVNGGRAPKIVFTEACYGAHVIGKSTEDALALRFLDRGTHAVVGSTKVSYGSVTPPLIAADLLGRRFWENLNRKLPVGEALRRAKLELVSEMHERQGYLDGEDQKALISFVLYGDPLYAPRQVASVTAHKSVARRKSRPNSMRTACAKGHPSLSAEELDDEAQERVRTIVSRYLPGMSGATCTIHAQHHGCDADDHLCPSHQLGMKGLPQRSDEPLVVTLSKRIPSGDREHPHYARLTLDRTGKVLKLAVSR